MIRTKRLLLGAMAALSLTTAIATAPSFAKDSAPVSTAVAVAAAQWAEDVTVTLEATAFRYQSDGIPNHELPEAYVVPKDPGQSPFGSLPDSAFDVFQTSEWLQVTPIDVTIPLTPVYSETPTQTSLGIIGVMISGGRLFNDYEDHLRENVAADDQKVIGNAKFLDDCTGHPLASGTSYHYHGVPTCITETTDSTGEHSTMIGVLLDGFPVYGPQGADGNIMTNMTLDACSGHFEATPEFPDGIYHYHLTNDSAPYSIDCYHGVVDESIARADMPQQGGDMPGQANAGQGPDFAAVAKTLGVTEGALVAALGQSMPPDFASAAERLGISEADFRAAMPPPPNRP